MIFIMMTNVVAGLNFLVESCLSRALENHLSNFNDHGDSGATDLLRPPEAQFFSVLMVEMSVLVISE